MPGQYQLQLSRPSLWLPEVGGLFGCLACATCRRAAHFANFNDEAEDDGGVHVGNNEVCTGCLQPTGPATAAHLLLPSVFTRPCH